MKRLISWIVLCLLNTLVGIVIGLIVKLSGYAIGIVRDFNTFTQICIYLIGGSTFLYILFAPVIYAPPIVVNASEAICPSKTGTRYKAVSIFMIILYVIEIFLGFTTYSTINVGAIIICVYYITFLIVNREFLKTESKHTPEETHYDM